jgi:hypothetical protein
MACFSLWIASLRRYSFAGAFNFEHPISNSSIKVQIHAFGWSGLRTVAVSAFMLVALFSTGAWGCWCDNAPASVSSLPTAAALEGDHTAFKGISLGSRPGDVAASSLRNGFRIHAASFVAQPQAISSIHICRGNADVGIVDFDENGRALRIGLQTGYFFERPITVRDFAEAVFKHYSVRRDEIADDNCFQDVTCFRGRTKAREQFLILKIGGEIQLHVRQLRASEWADQGH